MTYLQPGISFLVLLLIIGGLLRRQTRYGRKLTIAAIIGLFLWSWPPAAALLSGTLEWWFPVTAIPPDDADAIVVLGANVVQGDPSQPETLPGFSSYVRSRHAGWLYRNWKPIPIVTSGGIEKTGSHQSVIAEAMAHTIEEQGVPASMIWMEDASQSTYENALYSTRILNAHGIRRVAVVTEAHHMLRAVKCFRKLGLTVTAAPCAFRSIRFHGKWTEFVPTPEAMLTNEDCLHEWVGLLWYWVSRKI